MVVEINMLVVVFEMVDDLINYIFSPGKCVFISLEPISRNTAELVRSEF